MPGARRIPRVALLVETTRTDTRELLTGFNVDDLCRKLNASRSTLDRRMKAALKCSPKEEILRVRFREVERLLRETDLTIEAISAQTGFAHSRYLQAACKEQRGCTPGEWRRGQGTAATSRRPSSPRSSAARDIPAGRALARRARG